MCHIILSILGKFVYKTFIKTRVFFIPFLSKHLLMVKSVHLYIILQTHQTVLVTWIHKSRYFIQENFRNNFHMIIFVQFKSVSQNVLSLVLNISFFTSNTYTKGLLWFEYVLLSSIFNLFVNIFKVFQNHFANKSAKTGDYGPSQTYSQVAVLFTLC